MSYSIRNKLSYVQICTQFPEELEYFLAVYSEQNPENYHYALSIIMQMLMRAGNTNGYYLPAEKRDIALQANVFKTTIVKLTNLYDKLAEFGVFDREMYKKYNILTCHTLQYSFLTSKKRNKYWEINQDFVLSSVVEDLKANDIFEKFADKLEKFVDKNSTFADKKSKSASKKSISVDKNQRKEKNIKEENRKEYKKSEVVVKKDDDTFLPDDDRPTTLGDCKTFKQPNIDFIQENSALPCQIIRDKSNLDVEIVSCGDNINSNDCTQYEIAQNNDIELDMTLDEFKERYPQKCQNIGSNFVVPKNVRLSEIANAIEHSANFLKQKDNLGLRFLIVNYNKVVNGFYNEIKFDDKKSTESKFIKHNYDTVDLNENYTDCDELLDKL